jgi:hypothetical protein
MSEHDAAQQKPPEQQQEEKLRREIERTRAEFEALSAEPARERPIVPLAAGIGVALVALWLVRRR